MVTKKQFSIVKGASAALAILALLLCIAGCSSNEVAQPADTARVDWVEGTVTNIDESELLVDVTSDSNGSLIGDVRVSIGEIDESIISSLTVGTMVKITYPGMVGMSNPPFISATELTVIG